VGHFTGQLRIQRSMKSLSDLIFNEVRSANISERQSSQHAARFSVHVVIDSAADTLFELVGKHKYFG